MNVNRMVGACCFAVILASAGCATSGETLRQETSISALSNQLENEGMTLIRTGAASIPQFNTTGVQFDVGRGGTLHLYEYESEEQASLDADRADGIASDANVFMKGNVVAVYFGRSLNVQTSLANVMGPRLF